MAQRFSISTKQAVLVGAGALALVAGAVVALLHANNKKQPGTGTVTKKQNNTKYNQKFKKNGNSKK